MQLPAVADAPDQGTLEVVRAALGCPDLEVDVLAAMQWTAASQVATAFRSGPVFLVGDAAHRVPPAGATGLSVAMADVHNLAWKLAAVHRAWADPLLLASYPAKREPVAHRNRAEVGLMWRSTLTGEPVDPAVSRTIRQLDLGYVYRSAAVVGEDSPDPDGPGDYRPTGYPGVRAPRVWLAPGRSILDLFTGDVVLLTGPDGGVHRDGAVEVAGALGIPLDCPVLDDSSGWREVYEIAPDGAVLVRPDGHIAWRQGSLGQLAERPGAGRGDRGSAVSDALLAVAGRDPLPVSSDPRFAG